MKIAIVTWFASPNYGTFLQAYALQEFLRKNGFETDLIDFKPIPSIFAKVRFIIFSIFPFLKYICKYSHMKNIFTDDVKRILKTSCTYTLTNSHKIEANYDIFISGSDQIWSPENKYLNFFLLDFIKSKKCISYASSLGGNNITGNYVKLFIRELQKFSAISVREELTKKSLECIIDKKVNYCVDPVFLLNSNEWSNFFISKKVKQQKTIVLYLLGFQNFYNDVICKIHEYYSDYKMYQICLGNEKAIDSKYIEKLHFINSLDFLSLINSSELVLTDSYHATVFSVLFHTNFLHLLRFEKNDPTNQNLRVIELLQEVSLNQNIVYDKSFTINKPINIDSLSLDMLNQRIRESKEYLLKSILGK